MEDTHGVIPKEEKATVKAVLIFIIMEDTHGEIVNLPKPIEDTS